MYNFIIELMQLDASLPREELLRIVEITPLIECITYATIAEAMRPGADQLFAQAMERLGDLHCVNRIVDAGTVYQLESIACPLSNLHASEQSVLLAL
jgi:hypothetical protein